MGKMYPSAKWQQMKRMNAYLVSVNKSDGRSMRESACVESRMTIEGVPSAGRRYVSQRDAMRRYERREEAREPMYGRNVFRDCQVRRPEKGKAKNRYSREEAGTMGTQMTTRRFDGSYITVYCKSRKQY